MHPEEGTIEEVRQKILSVPVLLYTHLEDKQVHLPKFESNICTHKFLLDVRNREVFLMDRTTMRSLKFHKSPIVEVLQEQLIKLLKKAVQDKVPFLTKKTDMLGKEISPKHGVISLIEHLENRLADKAFLLEWISTLRCNGVQVDLFANDRAKLKRTTL